MPRWDRDELLRRGRVAYRLGAQNASVLERRLPAGELEQMRADRARLGDPEASDARARLKQKVATRTERSLSEAGYALITRIRGVVTAEKDAPKELRTAIGVGDKLDARNTNGVLTILASIIEREAALAAYGILPEDIEEARQIHTDLRAADLAQDDAMDARQASTEARQDAHIRLEESIVRLSARAAMAFRHDPILAARFERLRSQTGPTKDDEDAAGEEPIPVDPSADPVTP